MSAAPSHRSTVALPGVLVEPAWLARHLDASNLVVADCRVDPKDPQGGKKAYLQGHIPGAHFFDLDKDLAGPAGPRGGRHPLPDMTSLSKRLGEAGIGEGTAVVCYDDQGGSVAGRLWWLLRYLGHDEVAVLNGGFSAWVRERHPVATDVPPPRNVFFRPRPRPHMAVTADEVRRGLDDPNIVLIDARAPARYRGDTEPLDPVAGHIPGAVNVPWETNLQADGRFKDPEKLAEQYRRAIGDRPVDQVIVYCGSGVTACHNLVAMEAAGLRGARLYPGSWSDWCSHPEFPIEKGEGRTR